MIDFHMLDVAEMMGATNGLIGAYLLAFKTRYTKFGWIAYLLSNCCWLVFAILLQRNWLLVQTIGFTVSSLIGIWNHILSEHYSSILMRSKGDGNHV